MPDEEKIKLMTKAALYEKDQSADGRNLSRYYKEDYVKYGMLRTVITTTIGYWLVIAVYVMLKFNRILEDISKRNYFRIVVLVMAGYAICLVVFLLYAFVVYNVKYEKARAGIIRYNKNLKRLLRLYARENRTRRPAVHVSENIGGDDPVPEERGAYRK